MRIKKIIKPRNVLLMLFIILFITASSRIGSQILEYHSGEKSIEKAIDIAKGTDQAKEETDIQNIAPDTAPMPADPDKDFLLNLDIDKLQAVNSDVIGWILIPGTEISYPLLQAKDNVYYLKHSWDKSENSCGSIFYDFRSSPEDWNTVIYGHNMRNGSMFADLHKFKEDNFRKENNRLRILLNGEVKEYVYAAAFEADMDGVPYMFGDLSNQEKDLFLKGISEKAGKEISRSNSFISLSTCTGFGHNTRWVVVFCAESQEPQAEIRFLNEGVIES